MGMLQTGNMARQPHTGSGRATFARRASALTWLVRSMMILCAAGCPKPMVQESIVKVSIGAPSVIDTLAGPVTYPVTYANAAEISLYPDDVTLATSGSVTGRVSVHGLGTSARNVTISNIRGNGSASIALAAGTASDASGNPAPRAVATKAFYAHAVLEPGSGFTAPPPQPPALWSGAGADPQAQARWDVVPYQTLTTLRDRRRRVPHQRHRPRGILAGRRPVDRGQGDDPQPPHQRGRILGRPRRRPLPRRPHRSPRHRLPQEGRPEGAGGGRCHCREWRAFDAALRQCAAEFCAAAGVCEPLGR